METKQSLTRKKKIDLKIQMNSLNVQQNKMNLSKVVVKKKRGSNRRIKSLQNIKGKKYF